MGIPAELLRRRPDVRAAELKAVAQSAQVGMAEADLYPAFRLGGVLGTVASSTNGSSLNKLFTAPSISFAFGPSFSWPILNYGQITNNVRAQDAELQALLINYKNTVLERAARGRGRPQRLHARAASRSPICGKASRRQATRSPWRSPSTSSARATSPPC